jgi:hypothetical protein
MSESITITGPATTVIVCCYCNEPMRIVDPKDRTFGYDFCPHCKGRFSFDAPRVVDLGGGI